MATPVDTASGTTTTGRKSRSKRWTAAGDPLDDSPGKSGKSGSTRLGIRRGRRQGNQPATPPAQRGIRRGSGPKTRRNRQLLVVVAVTAVAAVACFAAWALLGSSWFVVSDVTVTGERNLTVSQVRSAAAVPLGTPLVSVNLDAVQQRVLRLKEVATATVHRSWPHTIAITMTERNPVAAVSSVGRSAGGWGLVDNTGVVFRTVPSPPAGLPALDVPAPRPPGVLRSAAVVAASLPRGLLSQVRSIHAQSLDSITLLLRNGSTVLWGDAANNAAKAQVLSVLLKHRSSAYDVSVPAEPALTHH